MVSADIYKEHTPTRAINLFVGTIQYRVFDLKGWQVPSIEQLLHQTDKNNHRSCSVKKLYLKISQY